MNDTELPAYRWHVDYLDSKYDKKATYEITAPTASDAITMSAILAGRVLGDDGKPRLSLQSVQLAPAITCRRTAGKRGPGRGRPPLGVHPERFAAIEAMLREGHTLHEIRIKTSAGQQQIRKVADQIGWNTAWRKMGCHHRKCGALDREEIKRLYCEAGLPLVEIGRMAAVTRERIRQVLEEDGVRVAEVYAKKLEAYREFKAELKRPEQEAIEARRAANEHRYLEMKTDWEATMEEPSMQAYQRYADKYSLARYNIIHLIYHLRKTRGWFPPRTSLMEEYAIDFDRTKKLFDEGVKIGEIAKQLNVPRNALSRWMARHREHFPKNGNNAAHMSREVRYEPARALWDQGKTAKEIAEVLGVKTNTAAITICELRAKKGWFPTRWKGRVARQVA